MELLKGKTFAIDFDGTLIDEGLYPEFGEPKPNAIHTMKRIINEGGRVVIWTCRGGEDQKQRIINKLNEYGLYNIKVNEHFPETLDKFDCQSPKIYVDYYIDDRSLFCNEIDWYEIEKLIFKEVN